MPHCWKLLYLIFFQKATNRGTDQTARINRGADQTAWINRGADQTAWINRGTDQTAWMRRLVCAYVVCIQQSRGYSRVEANMV